MMVGCKEWTAAKMNGCKDWGVTYYPLIKSGKNREVQTDEMKYQEQQEMKQKQLLLGGEQIIEISDRFYYTIGECQKK